MTVEGAGCNLGDERGYTIAVALAEYMDLPPEDMRNEKALEEKAREFAMTLRQRWRFGQCDDDVVIFLSSGDMKLWTAVGSEAGKLLTPQLILSVSEEAGKLFKQKDYTRGLLQVIGQYKLALQGKKVNVSKDGPHLPLGLPLWLLIVIAVLIVIVIIVLVVVIIKCCCTSKRDYQMARRTS
uniref:TPM domain-containing protein n=1 Tax=Plectus sambesii TaxID=2011161 RepID=A0A914UMV0_9BILA